MANILTDGNRTNTTTELQAALIIVIDDGITRSTSKLTDPEALAYRNNVILASFVYTRR